MKRYRFIKWLAEFKTFWRGKSDTDFMRSATDGVSEMIMSHTPEERVYMVNRIRETVLNRTREELENTEEYLESLKSTVNSLEQW